MGIIVLAILTPICKQVFKVVLRAGIDKTEEMLSGDKEENG